MDLRELPLSDEATVVSLWTDAGLIRPWNDPSEDFRRAVTGPGSAVLGALRGDELIGTVMVGDDGHRGWVYYLAVRLAERRMGVGRTLMSGAEHWLEARGVVKIQLMVRSENAAVLDFYKDCGYEIDDVLVLSRRLKD